MATRTAPVHYSDQVWKGIISRLEDGESLRAICQDEAMPNRSAVTAWLRKWGDQKPPDPRIDQYTRAREHGWHTVAEEIIAIADDASRDTITKTDKQGNEYETANTEWINRARLRVDARKWLLGKMMPKVYGDSPELANLIAALGASFGSTVGLRTATNAAPMPGLPVPKDGDSQGG